VEGEMKELPIREGEKKENERLRERKELRKTNNKFNKH
jgi:hypothetical protein